MGNEGDQGAAESWDSLQSFADEQGSTDASRTWVPPVFGALVRASRATTLERLIPFTSLTRLCFRDRQWLDGATDAPAHIDYWSGEYEVYSGSPYGRHQCVLTTSSPQEAACEAERLLSTWKI